MPNHTILPDELIGEIANLVPNETRYNTLWQAHRFFTPSDDRIQTHTTPLTHNVQAADDVLRILAENPRINALDISFDIEWNRREVEGHIEFLEKLLIPLSRLKVAHRTNIDFVIFTGLNKHRLDDSGALVEFSQRVIAPILITTAYHFGHKRLFDFFPVFFWETATTVPSVAVQIKSICQLVHIAFNLKYLPQEVIDVHPILLNLSRILNQHQFITRSFEKGDVYGAYFHLARELQLNVSTPSNRPGGLSGRGGNIVIGDYLLLQNYLSRLIETIHTADLTDQLINPTFGTNFPGIEEEIAADVTRRILDTAIFKAPFQRR